jgi:hypothetical protein
MCDIISAIGLAISAAQGFMQYQAQDAAYQQQERQYEQNRLNALQSFRDQQVATSIRQIQEQETAAAERFDTAQDARAARATAMTAAGEGGVTGFSVEHLMRDMYARESRSNDRVDQNLDWTMAQLDLERKQQSARTLDRINSVPRGQKPSFADAALRIAASGLNTATSYQQRTGKSPFPAFS